MLSIFVLPSTSCCLLPRWEEQLPPEARSGEEEKRLTMPHIHDKIDFTVAIFVVQQAKVLLVHHRPGQVAAAWRAY